MMFVGRITPYSSILFTIGLSTATADTAFASSTVPDAVPLSVTSSASRSMVPPPSDPPGDCGRPGDPVPEISLVDLNPNSGTYADHYTLDTFQSEVVVIYWALAS